MDIQRPSLDSPCVSPVRGQIVRRACELARAGENVLILQPPKSSSKRPSVTSCFPWSLHLHTIFSMVMRSPDRSPGRSPPISTRRRRRANRLRHSCGPDPRAVLGRTSGTSMCSWDEDLQVLRHNCHQLLSLPPSSNNGSIADNLNRPLLHTKCQSGRTMIVLDAVLWSFDSCESCNAVGKDQAIVGPTIARRLPGALGARHGHQDRSNYRHSGRETT
jgi:hypothetical protein